MGKTGKKNKRRNVPPSQKLSDGKSRELFDEAIKAHQEGRLSEADKIYRQLLRHNPGHEGAHNLLGVLTMQRGNWSAALNHVRKAVEVAPDYAEGHLNLGVMCRDLLLLEEAGESLRKAVSLKPGYARAHYNLGTVLELKGHYGEAADNYELAVRYQPRDIPAWQRLVNLKKFTDENGLLDRLQDAISEGTDMTASDKMYFEYILGRACADMRDYPGAFESILKAKSFEAKITPGPKDPLADKPFMELIIEKCTPEFFKERAEYGSKAVAAVIFGMPASGIKPVDKILSSVSRARVVTPGVAANIIQRLFGPDSRLPDFSSVDGDFIEKAVKRHLKSLRGIAKDTPSVIIDSSPVNFFNVWILKLMYPEASLFHCVRDAADTCLDTFFSHSHPLRRFSLKDTGIYYRDIYQPLARHWEKLFPDSLTRVNYAELAESPLEAARSVVKAAGLEWRDECGIFSGAPPDSTGISSLYGERMAELKKIIS